MRWSRGANSSRRTPYTCRTWTSRTVLQLRVLQLCGKRGVEGKFGVVDEGSVPVWVDPYRCAITCAPGLFAEQVEVDPMRAEENVAGQHSQRCEGMAEVGGDAGVRRWACGAVDEVEVRPETDSADDDDIAQRTNGLARKVRT